MCVLPWTGPWGGGGGGLDVEVRGGWGLLLENSSIQHFPVQHLVGTSLKAFAKEPDARAWEQPVPSGLGYL